MKQSISLGVAGLALTIGLALLPGAPAEARIRCHDEYQVNKEGEVLTPYCEESYLATVARAHGMSVTADQIRRDYGLEQQVCRNVGGDIRVSQFCSEINPPSHHHDCFGINCLN